MADIAHLPATGLVLATDAAVFEYLADRVLKLARAGRVRCQNCDRRVTVRKSLKGGWHFMHPRGTRCAERSHERRPDVEYAGPRNISGDADEALKVLLMAEQIERANAVRRGDERLAEDVPDTSDRLAADRDHRRETTSLEEAQRRLNAARNERDRLVRTAWAQVDLPADKPWRTGGTLADDDTPRAA